MQKTNSLKPAHKHVLAVVVVAMVALLWSFVIYPKMVLGINAPTDLIGEAGDGQVSLSWTAPAGDGKENESMDPISDYKITYSSLSNKEAVVYTGGEQTFTVTELINDEEYTFEVSALSGETESARSNAIKLTPTASKDGEGIALAGEPLAVPTTDSATISWETTLAGTSVVEYGPTADFKGEISSGAEKTNMHSIILTGLTPCAGYWYKVISYDDNSNLAESQGGEFKTTGCKGDSSIVTYEVTKITRDNGATLSVANGRGSINVSAPANIKSSLDAVAIEALKLEKDLVKTEISTPESKQWIGNAYSLKAFQDEKSEVVGTFDAPVEVSISYVDEDVSGIDLSTLTIYHYEDGAGWRALSNCVVDTSSKTVTCETTSFSIFGLFGEGVTSDYGGSGGGRTTSSGSTVAQAPTVKPTTIEPAEVVATTPTTNAKFSSSLGLGQKGAEVKKLQMFLNNAGFKVALTGPGSSGMETEFFGPLTFSALVKFQEAYKAQILAPLGLTVGTGFFGEKTRAFINSMN